MTFIRTTLIVLAAFACGTLSAAIFVSRPIPAPDAPLPGPAPVAASTAPQVQDPTPRLPAPDTRVIPLYRSPDQQDPQTTGSAPSQVSAKPAAPAPAGPSSAMASCNQSACSRKYRSFDSATCTYQPHRGAERRHCEK